MASPLMRSDEFPEEDEGRAWLAEAAGERDDRRTVDWTGNDHDWASSRGGVQAAVEDRARRLIRSSIGLVFSLPAMWWAVTKRSPHGLWRVLAVAAKFAADMDRKEVRDDIRNGTGVGLARIDEAHHRAMWIRSGVVLVLSLLLVSWVYSEVLTWRLPPGVELAGIGLPDWFAVAAIQGPLWATATVVLGVIGRPVDRPLIPSIVYRDAGPPKITNDLIVDALDACGIPKMTKAVVERGVHSVRFYDPPTRVRAGTRSEFDLPAGVTVEMVVDNLGAFAGVMQRSEERITVTKGVHESRCKLYVADKALSELAGVGWVLYKPGKPIKRFDIFDPIPMGLNLAGEPVGLSMIERFGVMGGMTGSGKTAALRLIAMGCALDPTVELRIHDFKGGGDFMDVGEACAHTYYTGQSDADLQGFEDMLTEIHLDMARRYETLRELKKRDREITRHGYTRQLANRRDLRLHPVVIIVDETQIPFEAHKGDREDTQRKTRIRRLATDIAKQGRAVGIMMWFATQSVNDTTIPVDISRQAGARICLRVTDDKSTNQILGQGSHSAGYRPDKLTEADAGVGYITGDGEGTQQVRFPHVHEIEDLVAIAEAARSFREQDGRLTGMAAGEIEPDDHHPDALDHTVAVWPRANPDRLAFEDLLPLLAEHFGGSYRRLLEVDGDKLPESYKALGRMLQAPDSETAELVRVESVQVPKGDRRPRGVRLADVVDVIEVRDAGQRRPGSMSDLSDLGAGSMSGTGDDPMSDSGGEALSGEDGQWMAGEMSDIDWDALEDGDDWEGGSGSWGRP
ncbi:MAG: FtsK/SpoIIIE domain-containing protein [Acidimicrobiales bacterium]